MQVCHDTWVYFLTFFQNTTMICYHGYLWEYLNNCPFLPGFGPSYSTCTYTPCHGHRPRTCPASPPPSRHCGNHGPGISYQYSVNISTEPGHHRSSKTQINRNQKQNEPERFSDLNTRGCCCRWHHLPPILLLLQAIQHIEGTQGKACVGEEEQRRAVIVTSGRVLSDAAGSDTASNSDGPDDCSLPWVDPWCLTRRTLTYTHTLSRTQKGQADHGCRRRQTHSTLVQWTLIGLVGRLKHLFFGSFHHTLLRVVPW